jgi:hypothetical protein
MKTYTSLFCCLLLSFIVSGQNLRSVNIKGNRLGADNSMSLHKGSNEWMAFGTNASLSIQFFDFERGATQELAFFSTNGDLNTPTLQGAGGMAENDTTFIVWGQMDFPDDLSHLVLIKAQRSGKILWAKRFVHGGIDMADRVVKLSNGDLLLSMHQDKREDQFGGLISGAAVFRFSSNGDFLWSYQIDDAQEKNASLRSVTELPSGRLLLTIRKAKNLQLLALDAAGQFLYSRTSTDELLPAGAVFHTQSQRLLVVGENKQLLLLDTLFQQQSAFSYTHNDLQRFTGITLLNDSAFVISGVFKNEAFVGRVSFSSFAFTGLHHHNFFPFTSSLVQGMFVIKDTFYSVYSNGFAVNRHNNDLSHPCFTSVNGNLIVRNTEGLSSFQNTQATQSLGGTWQAENSIRAEKNALFGASVNCNPYDISVRMPLMRYTNSCRNVDLRFYVFNNGTQAITDFKLKYYYKDSAYEKRIQTPAISSKTGVFIDYGSLYLDQGESRVTFSVSEPNGQTDGFPLDDSLYADFVSNPPVNISITGKTPICENENNLFRAIGPEGLYGLERNGALILQSSQPEFIVSGGGAYRFQYRNNFGCLYYSPLLEVETWEQPPQPALFISNQGLETDAALPNYWYFNQVLIDSNKQSIPYQGQGTYSVEALSSRGCRSRTDLPNVVIGIHNLSQASQGLIIYENRLYWPHAESAHLRLFSIEGKTLFRGTIGAGETLIVSQKPGMYWIETTTQSGSSIQKMIGFE